MGRLSEYDPIERKIIVGGRRMPELAKNSKVAKPVKVTISEPDTGEILEERVLEDDFFLIPHGRVYLDSSQSYSNGTVVLTLKRRTGDV